MIRNYCVIALTVYIGGITQIQIQNQKLIMQILKQLLVDSQTNRKFIGIRTYGSDEEFWCGYVLSFNDKLVEIQHFTEYGQPDGVLFVQMDDIEGIESGNKYAETIEYLFQVKSNNEDLSEMMDLPNGDSWQSEILSKFIGKRVCLALKHDDENTYYGRVDSLDLEFLKLQAIDKLGDTEGYITLRVQNISSIQNGNVESVKRNTLFASNRIL